VATAARPSAATAPETTTLRYLVAAAILLGLTASAAQAAPEGAEPRSSGEPVSPLGEWLTEDRGGVIDIFSCGQQLCGRIVGMSEPLRPDGTVPKDKAGQPKCGLTILRQGISDGSGQWSARITDPDDGSQWNCILSVDDEGRLHLRGYVLVPLLGQTQIWTRYAGRVAPNCRMATS
jgi:uncharacterized protein (DUF2147 family)